MAIRWFVVLLALAALVSLLASCSTLRNIIGSNPKGDPTTLTSAEARWLLIKNPRYGDVPSEPEYVWVEEDKVPTTLTTLVRGQRAIIAPPEVVAKYGPPPGGGKVSPRQGVPYQIATEPAPAARAATPAKAPGAPVVTRATGGRPDGVPAAAVTTAPKRGWVVYVDTTRIVIDLTTADGVRAGGFVSLRRDRIPIVHPVTGEVLGELDEEVGTARVTETREKFSVAEIETVAPGSQVQVRDRVVPK